MLGYARAIAPDLGDADRELIVEMAVEAGVRSIDRFDPGRGGLRGWFRRQVRWKTSEWRRTGPAAGAPLLADPEAAAGDDPELPEFLADNLRAVIAELSEDDRLLLALRAVEGLGHTEIGLRLDLNSATVRQRYKRLLERLRAVIRGQPELAAYLSERGVK